MSTLELKQELHEIIENSDENMLFELKSYISNTENIKMIEESEDDIAKGNLHSQADVKKMIESWRE